jgi:hypothetical protein
MFKPIKAVALSLAVGAVGVVALASAPACSSGGGVCGGTSKCSADTPPTQSAIDQCNKLAADACGSQYVDLGNCAKNQQTCAADNTTDGTATAAAIQANCGTQATAYATCCANNTTACK